MRQSNDAKNWPSMRRQGRPIIVDRAHTPACSSIGAASTQNRVSCPSGSLGHGWPVPRVWDTSIGPRVGADDVSFGG